MPASTSRRLALTAEALRFGARHFAFVEKEILGLSDWVAPGAVAIDIGAEYGLYAWTLADLVGADGQVVVVEPQPGLARALRRNARLLGAVNVEVRSLALSDVTGEGSLSQPQRGGLPVHGRTFLADDTSGLGSNAEFSAHRSISVPVETLDNLVSELGLERVDFIKADVEGAEARLLAGGAETLRRFRPTLLVELEDRHLSRFDTTVAAVVEWLAGFGYTTSHWEPWTRGGAGSWLPGIAPGLAGRNVLFRAS